jgi:hypothetical protein
MNTTQYLQSLDSTQRRSSTRVPNRAVQAKNPKPGSTNTAFYNPPFPTIKEEQATSGQSSNDGPIQVTIVEHLRNYVKGGKITDMVVIGDMQFSGSGYSTIELDGTHIQKITPNPFSPRLISQTDKAGVYKVKMTSPKRQSARLSYQCKVPLSKSPLVSEAIF